MNRFSALLIALAGLGFLAFGLAFLVSPLPTLAAAGLVLEGPIAATELRAFYGGLELGLGGYLLVCAWQPSQRRAGLWLTLASNGGIGLSRLLGLVLSGVFTPFFALALAWELGLACLAAVCLARGANANG